MPGAKPFADTVLPADATLVSVLAGVLAASRLGVLLLSPDGAVRWHNAAAAAIIAGRSDAPLQGQPLSGFVHDDALPALAQLAAGLGQGGTQRPGVDLPLKDGQRWLRLELQPVSPALREQAGIGGAVSVFDVTEQRRERQEADREGMLLREAERSSRAKSEFLSRVSHELRTPLNGVLGFAQLLQHRAGELPGWTAEPLRMIRQAGDHLLTLIDDMLDLGSIESGTPRLTLGPVSLDAVTGEALRLVAPQALAAGVALRPWGPSQAWVRADATRLRQVLLNLLCNAIRYNRVGGEVRLLLDSTPGAWTLRVVDSGPGISSERRRELFQPFNRPGAESAGMQGSGLGLTMARHLTEAMGGRLELAPPGGSGTELRVTLPRAEPAPAALAQAAGPEAAKGPPGACRVLYVEDHPVNAMLVSEALAVQQPRHQLRLAETGEQGLEMVAAERPDIVLLDLNLPGADGYEVLARLRADPAWCHMPCVAVSADAMPEELARARAAGFDDYWTKPLTMVGLADRISRIVAGAAAAG